MKIIFETEAEKEEFIRCGCPGDIPTVMQHCDHDYDYEEKICTECWKNSGIILEVEDND